MDDLPHLRCVNQHSTACTRRLFGRLMEVPRVTQAILHVIMMGVDTVLCLLNGKNLASLRYCVARQRRLKMPTHMHANTPALADKSHGGSGAGDQRHVAEHRLAGPAWILEHYVLHFYFSIDD